jgi:LTXXQ motif family protein
MRSIRTLLLCACFLVLPNLVAAQTQVRQQAKPSGWGARTVLLPVLTTHGGVNALCNPRAAQLATRSVDQIDRFIAPTPPQRVHLEELKAALSKATDLTNGVCPNAIPQSSQARLAFMARRLGSLHEAVKTVSEVFDTFYASLSDEQKVSLDAGPRRWRWPRFVRSAE